MELNQEVSPAPSASSKGLKIALSKVRRKNDPSVESLNEADEGERGGVRQSVDSLIDRARINRGGSVDDGLPSGPSNLSKLIPGRVKKKKKLREEAEQAQKEAEDGRGRSVDDQTATSALSSPPADNRSRSTLGDGEGGLVIDDYSEPESPTIAKPSLASHNSHIGYLTTSSPLIRTTTAVDTPPEQPLDSPTFLNPQYQKSATLPMKPSDTSFLSTLTLQHAATIDTKSGLIQPSKERSRSRGVSPGARIKDALTVGSRKKGGSPPKSPDRASQASSITDVLKKGGKRNSINLVPEDSAASLNTVDPVKSPNGSVRDLPTISTTPTTPVSATSQAPETVVTPPTPVDRQREFRDSPSLASRPLSASAANPNIVVSSSGNMLSHRRIRSDSASNIPSKLSQAMGPPLTPMAEEARTPGGGTRSVSQNSAGAGFFSSVFSAAQNMTTTLTNNMTNPTRSRSSTQTDDSDATVIHEEEIDSAAAEAGQAALAYEKKPLAVETLGSGDLKLSHLGISTDSLVAPSANGSISNGERSKTGMSVQREEAAARATDASAARAVSAAYSEKAIGGTPVAEDTAPIVKPRSTYEASIVDAGEATPPNGSINEGAESIRRSGSVRSRVGGVMRKHRNSSSVTSHTIGAAIGAGSALANSGGTKPTGFAVASKKRNREFHQLFRSVPEDDYLIEDYSCALQREIILAGRIYVSEGHICFSSNILGWVTTLVISFDEVVSVEKESTAVVFPNAIAVQTLHARHTYRSLLSREATYELIIGIWRLSHPNLKSSLNGARLDQGGTGDKTEKVDPSGSDDTSDISEEEEEVYDEDQEEDGDQGSVTENGGGSIAPSLGLDEKANGRKASQIGLAIGAAATTGPTAGEWKAAAKAAEASAVSVDFPGPTIHAPTECPDGASHLDKELKDDIIPAPLGKVWAMTFGPASGGFMAKWLVDDMKCTDLQFEDRSGLSEDVRSRSMTYIKPLYASIGPKSTKCVVTETLDLLDLEKAVCVTASTQTPDVPSGNIFVTKTHFCFMWAANNATRVIINYSIEWSGKSWLKGPIEKGATDGQTTYCNDLVKALKVGVTRSRAGTSTGAKTKTKGGKRGRKSASPKPDPISGKSASTNNASASASSWGSLEPIHSLVSPVTDIFAPFIGANTIIGFLLFTILFNYLRSPDPSTSSTGLGPLSAIDRMAAYEQLWRREEADLWDWLDQRVGATEQLSGGSRGDGEKKKARALRLKVVKDLKMSEREVERAIRVTEDRLGVLKRVVREGKAKDEESLEDHGESGEDGGGGRPAMSDAW